jgi:serine protease Do
MMDTSRRPAPAPLLLGLLGLLAVPGAARPEAPEMPGLEPLVAEVSLLAVAIEVTRGDEPPNLSALPVKSAARLPQDIVDYYTRPKGPVTGILLDRDGNILTSWYNVMGAVKEMTVVLPGGVRRPARLVATDRSDDLALLRAVDPPADLQVPPVRWALTPSLRVGRMLVVLGRSPDPARPTVTFGIVSALGRNGGRAFQTDAKLNYGNVGGPIALLDGSIAGLAGFVGPAGPPGHVWGMWGMNSGIGFGTRADTIQAVLPRLLKGENIPPPENPYLGVGPSNLPAPGNVGARIGTVERGSGADRAGLRVNDVILAIDGEKVEDFLDLRRLINRHRPGDEAAIQVLRDQKRLDLTVRLGKRPE